MNEKRLYPRYSCKMKAKFRFYEGDPDLVNRAESSSKNGKGLILDISRGGMLLAANSQVSVNLPIELEFRTHKQKFSVEGTIVRTGFIKNNPAIEIRKFGILRFSKKFFIAVKFTETLNTLNEADILKA